MRLGEVMDKIERQKKLDNYEKKRKELWSKAFKLNQELKMTMMAIEIITGKERNIDKVEPTEFKCDKCGRIWESSMLEHYCCNEQP
jgi:hypothetical protein